MPLYWMKVFITVCRGRCTASWKKRVKHVNAGIIAIHPVYQRPELLATAPNELWSWDITKLKGHAKWTYFYLYVILDVFQPLRGRLDGRSPGKCGVSSQG